MHYKQSVFKTRWLSWLTLLVFTMLSVVPFPGYAQQVNWDELRSQGLMVSDQLDDEGYRLITTDANRTVSLTAFDQGLTDKWKFNLGGNNLNFNITGDAATTWSGTTNVLNGILGLFNSHGIHFTETSKINLTNAGFIGAAMRAVDGTSFNNLKLAGNGYLLNEGKISGGNIALLGGAVENKGTIDAPLNQVTIAGGKAITVGLSGDNLISVVVDEATDTNVKDFDGNTLSDQIKNSGNITAHKIKLDAKGVDSVFEKAINLKGELKAVDLGTNDKGEIVMMSMDDVYSKAILEAEKIYVRAGRGDIDMLGTTKAKMLDEQGASFQIGGIYHVEQGQHDNLDHAITYAADTNLSGTIQDDENIVINSGVTVTLGGNTSLIADSAAGTDEIVGNEQDGTGAILMNEGSKIVGGGFDLSLAGSGQSIIREITGIDDLTLTGQTAGAQFTLRRAIDMEGDLTVNEGATLDGGFSVTVRGGDVTGAGDINMTGGIFTVIGNGSFGGSQDWNFNQLVFGDGATEATTQKTGSNKITIAQDWTIKELHTLRGGSSTWDVTWGDGVMTDIVQVVGGAAHTLALSSSSANGYVYAWGSNAQGQLGIGSSSGTKMVPVKIESLSGVKKISAGSFHSLAVLADGTAKAWGLNSSGQLGLGYAGANVTTPTTIAGLTNIKEVSGGGYFSLALLETGELYGWGQNSYGEIGDGTTSMRVSPTRVRGENGVGFLEGVASISTGNYHSLALLIGGGVMSWGANTYGQLGIGSNLSKSSPVSITGLTNVTKVSASTNSSYALLGDGTVRAWGYNFRGELGDATTTNRTAPVQVRGVGNVGYLLNVKDISSGGESIYATLTSGSLLAWGANNYGQLGDQSTTDRLTPVVISGVNNVSKISMGQNHGLMLLEDGSIKATGLNSSGQLGDSTSVSRSLAIKVIAALNLSVNKLTDIISITSGISHTLALRGLDGAVFAWGANDYGQLGDGASAFRTIATQVRGEGGVGFLLGAKSIAAGDGFSVAALSDGSVRSWGKNWFGQLGDGTTADRATPVKVQGVGGVGYLSGVLSVAAGWGHSLALLNSGEAVSWGNNFAGALGDGTATSRSAPVRVKGVGNVGFLSNIKAIAAGDSFSLALLNNGEVRSWGSNFIGQLGDGTTTDRSTPVQVVGVGGTGVLSGVSAIAAGYRHSLALVSSDGSVRAWGANYYGALGDNTSTYRSSPVQVKGLGGSGFLTGISSIDAGGYHSLAVSSGGELFSWGYNNKGQIGDNSTTNRLVPVRVKGVGGVGNLSGVTSIGSGVSNSSALSQDGVVLTWGLNDSGQIGNNSNTDSYYPVYTVGGFTFEPFVVDGTFVTEQSTVSYSGDIVIGGQQVTTQIADVNYHNLELQNRADDYSFRGIPATEEKLKEITGGSLIIHGEMRKAPEIDMSNVVQVDPRERMLDILQMFGSGDSRMAEMFKMLFGGNQEMRIHELKAGMNEFEVTPQDLGMDQGMDQFQKMIFDAETQPEEERKVLDSEKQTDTVLATVTGNARVVASDGKIYEAKPGMTLAKGDQVWTDNSAKVELSNKGDVVTVNSGSAVVVSSAPAAANDSNVVNAGESAPVQDLLQIAFGKVSVAVSGEDSQSSFVVQTPNGMSGLRG